MARDYNNPVDYSGRPRNKLTAEDQRSREAAFKRWQEAQSQPVSDRKAGSEPVERREYTTDDSD